MNAVHEVMEQLRKALEERDNARATWEAVCMNLNDVEAERDRLREQLAAKHSECPDCADYAARSGRFAAQADKLQRERDEARNALFRADQDALRVEEERDQLRAELRMVREGCDGWLERCEQLSRERDNWKQSSDERNDECNRIQRTLNVCAEERDVLRRERDEARAELHASNEQMDSIAKALQLEHDDDIEDAVTDMVAEMEHARDRIEELRAEMERLREDDKAGLRRERDEACEMVTRIEQEAYRIKLEARAEVERLRAEVHARTQRITEVGVMVATNGNALAKDAYRRGAEAMRKQVMNWLVKAQAEATVIVVDTAIRGVHKLPIPEDEP